MESMLDRLRELGWPGAVYFALAFAAWLAHVIVWWVFARVAARKPSGPGGLMVGHWKRPTRYLLILLALRAGLPLLDLPSETAATASHVLAILLIFIAAWIAVRGTRILRDYVIQKYDIAQADNLEARRVHTQSAVLIRVVMVLIGAVAIGAALMTFEDIRALGTSILASAGIAGVIIGFAAQKTLSTFIAGLQIAMTQPIRLDDVVIVEGEWGWIEEITLTYVVVRIWDQRRLVMPITHFIDRPFQNWTRKSAEILGTVFIYADYTVPIDALRNEVRRICEGLPEWDGRVAGLVATGATERTVELRALVSAADSGKAWTLRCAVREKLIEFLQKSHPDALPRSRVELDGKEPGANS